MNKIDLLKTSIVLSFALVSSAAPVHASEVDILVNKLVERNILTRIDAEAIRKEIEAERMSVRVPVEPQSEVKMATPVPGWPDGLTQKGDIRLRYEGFGLEDEDGRDRQRFRFRLRWGLEKRFNDEFRAGFRLASGPRDEATSTNQSFDDEFNAKDINIDRAYAVWTPNRYVQEVLGKSVTTELGGGKVANPYEKWGTSIVFDSDVNPEGAYEKLDIKLADVGDPAAGGRWDLNLLFGQFVLNENSTGEDSELYAHGIGTTYAWDKKSSLFVGFVYYDWQDYERLVASGSVLTSVNPGGNDRNLDAFRVASVYAEYNRPVPTALFGTQPLKVFGHYIQNLEQGSQAEAGDDGTGHGRSWNEDEDAGFSAGAQLGLAKEQGNWEAKYQWYYLESNATPGNFTEGDLGLGFANNRGHQLSLAYKIYDNITLQGSFWSVERIDAALSNAIQSTTTFEDREISRWQLDVVYAF